MAGLMPNKGAPPEQGAAPPHGAPAPAAEQAEPKMGAEEKRTFQEFLGNAMEAVYQPKAAEALANSMSGDSPVEPLAMAISGVVARVAYSGLENGQKISKKMAAAVAAALAADLGAKIPESIGKPPLTDEQTQAVFLRSMEMLAAQRDKRAMAGAAAQRARQPAPEPQAGNGMMPSGPPAQQQGM